MGLRERVLTDHSYSRAVKAGALVFLAHHRGVGETFQEELDDALRAVGATLGRFDLALDDLVQVNVWLRNVEDIPAMEERFRHHFRDGAFPARTTATTDFVDADCRLMIDGVAHKA